MLLHDDVYQIRLGYNQERARSMDALYSHAMMAEKTKRYIEQEYVVDDWHKSNGGLGNTMFRQYWTHVPYEGRAA